VSCIMLWPGTIPPGSTCNEITAGFDFFTTFALLAGAEIPSDRPIDGRDLYPIMVQEEGYKPHTAFSGYEAKGLHMSYREGQWKLTLPSKATYGIGQLDHYELYKLDTDPGEQQDVSAEYPFILEQMIDKAKAFDKKIKQ